MGYLLTQILLCMLLAFALGLFLGWLIWGRGSRNQDEVARLEKIWKANLASKEEELEKANLALNDCRSRVSSLQAAAKSAPAPAPKPAAPKPAASTGAFVPSDGSVKDDLKKIWGVGPFLERKLNENGVYTFKDVARLTRPAIEELSEKIGAFPDRIERDAWVQQAHKLHKEKYGEDV